MHLSQRRKSFFVLLGSDVVPSFDRKVNGFQTPVGSDFVMRRISRSAGFENHLPIIVANEGIDTTRLRINTDRHVDRLKQSVSVPDRLVQQQGWRTIASSDRLSSVEADTIVVATIIAPLFMRSPIDRPTI